MEICYTNAYYRCGELPKIAESLAVPFNMGRGRLYSLTFVRYLVICSLLLIAFLLYLRIEEESFPLNNSFSKPAKSKHLAVLTTQHFSSSNETVHNNISFGKNLYRVNYYSSI